MSPSNQPDLRAGGVFRAQDPGKLPQLGGVPRGQHDGVSSHGDQARASRCSLVSSPQPATARSSSWPSRSRLNGSCSAVP